MPILVLDSSVALAWVLRGERTPKTEALLSRTEEHGAVVTSLWPIEVANVLLTYERKKVMTAAERVTAIGFYAGLPIESDDQTAARAWSTAYDLALAHKLTVYDAGYLELALRSGLPLATLDVDLCHAATKLGVPVLGYHDEED
jgi:predicted nucleic acid-binding protein